MNIQLKKILAAVDFGDLSDRVLQEAGEMARMFGSELIICHVVDRPGLISRLPPGGEGYIPANLPEIQEQYAREQVAKFQQSSGLSNARLVTGQGSPASEVMRIAKEENADLIIQGTHGRGALAHALLGSVAERIVRSAPCPVLTIRARE